MQKFNDKQLNAVNDMRKPFGNHKKPHVTQVYKKQHKRHNFVKMSQNT
jgi:hypothetical protein